MPSPTDELIERVAAATGPDREIDAELWMALAPDPEDDGKDRDALKMAIMFAISDSPNAVYRPLTASLDAAVALVERALPGANWEISWSGGNWRPGYRAWARVQMPYSGKNDEEDGEPNAKADHTSAPIAILLALLRALKNMEEDDDD